jgi:DNA-binding beta-propeller fold protein YncE
MIGATALAASLLVLVGSFAANRSGPPADTAEETAAAAYRSPFDLAYSPDGTLLAVSDRTAGAVAFIDVAGRRVLRTVGLRGRPAGLTWSADGTRVYVAEYAAGSVAEVGPSGQVLRRFQTGDPYPMGLALAASANLLLVANNGSASVSAIDLSSGLEKARIAVIREPYFMAIAPDESTAAIGNLLPLGDATDATLAAALSLVDLKSMRKLADVRLPPGSASIRKLAISPDGKWAYAVHTLGRVTVPTTQLERGWVNTNALSIIDLAAKRHYATCLMDRLTEGAADPWGLVLSRDGGTLWSSLAGTHELVRIDLARLHTLMAGGAGGAPPGPRAPGRSGSGYGLPGIWAQIAADPKNRALLANDLSALEASGLMTRIRIEGRVLVDQGAATAERGSGSVVNGPRGIDLSPDGTTLAVAAYFSGAVVLAEAATGRTLAAISLGPQPQIDAVRRGEMIFHDATYCFQRWLSCATCHPNDGRVDGLNWDLLNDGLGNPKNNKSLLHADRTPPAMWRGVRNDMEAANTAGMRFILFREPQAGEGEALNAYVRSLRPEPSPLLVNGQLSEKARRGKTIFEGKANCAGCHSGPYFTDLKLHDVGTATALDPGAQFDTPTLIEIWRTAPCMHSGSAKTLHEVFTKFNRDDLHGTTSTLSEEELDALVAYLLSL